MELRNKRAFVTGASGDIGRAVAVALARAGAQVSFSYFSDHEGAQQTRQALEAIGPSPSILRANFGNKPSTHGFLAELEQLGQLDILVHAAASGVFRHVLEVEERHLDWAFDVNVKALLYMVQRLLAARGTPPTPTQALMPRGSSIIVLSSLGAERAILDYTTLGVAKAALVGLVRQLALTTGPLGVRINAVSPGLVRTRALQHLPNSELLVQEAERRTPLGRLTEATDVANVVAWLGSDAASMLHGQVLHVDGGYSVVG